MTILDKIIKQKKKEISQKKVLLPIVELEKSIWFERQTNSLSKILNNAEEPEIIAEFKKKSPSKGIINEGISVKDVTTGYAKAGAAAVSVLTDREFFGGNYNDIIYTRRRNTCPVLRKDFIIDEYHVIESKAVGADVILLIAAILDKKQMKVLADKAHSLGLEVLVEVHNEKEIGKIDFEADVIGVNNRNLSDFSVDLNTSIKLMDKLPKQTTKISESGISSPADVKQLYEAGFKGFLIGELFMKQEDPVEAFGQFLSEVRNHK